MSSPPALIVIVPPDAVAVPATAGSPGEPMSWSIHVKGGGVVPPGGLRLASDGLHASSTQNARSLRISPPLVPRIWLGSQNGGWLGSAFALTASSSAPTQSCIVAATPDPTMFCVLPYCRSLANTVHR